MGKKGRRRSGREKRNETKKRKGIGIKGSHGPHSDARRVVTGKEPFRLQSRMDQKPLCIRYLTTPCSCRWRYLDKFTSAHVF
jgi:hypothetical protein